jgi:hypothetical protein
LNCPTAPMLTSDELQRCRFAHFSKLLGIVVRACDADRQES